MSLLFNTLPRFVIAFLPRSHSLLIPWLQSPSAVILEPKKRKSVTTATFSPSICLEIMGQADDIKKRWQEYTEDLYKKDLHDPDNHDGVITHLEPDILECEVKQSLGSITMNKASGGDRIPVELFQILKGYSVLHSICQQIWKTQQWPQNWKMSVFIPIPKKGKAKECSNYRIIALISYASKVMLNILQARLQ